MQNILRAKGLGAVGLTLALAGCGTLPVVEADLRNWTNRGSATQSPASVPTRPAPDSNGVISYPEYQVAIARSGDTITTIASRLGLNAAELASHNAIAPTTVLNPGAVVLLPRRVAAGTPAARGTGGFSTGQVSDPFAGQGVRTPSILQPQTAAATPAAPAAAPAATPGQHRVAAGETAWSIARRYGIPVQALAQWNGLDANMTVRTGQTLLIPAANATQPPAAVTNPGAGSPTPMPPSAQAPLPAERTQPASTPVARPDNDLGATRTAASGSRFQMPVTGAIVRAYAKGTNEGIDIAAAAGTPVQAAGGGTVAAITRDVNDVPIVVIRHDGNLMTVYAGLNELTVQKGDSVSRGQTIGKATNRGSVHFEVRQGFDSVDPTNYL